MTVLNQEQLDIAEAILNDLFCEIGTLNGSVAKSLLANLNVRRGAIVRVESDVPGEFDQYEMACQFTDDLNKFTVDVKIVSDFNGETLGVQRETVSGWEDVDGSLCFCVTSAITEAVRGAVKDYA